MQSRWSKLQGTIELDPVDWAILDVLADHARVTNAALAERVGLPPSTCLNRVRGLVARGILPAYHARVDPRTLGLQLEVLVGLTLTDKRSPTVRSLIDEIKQLAHVIAVLRTSGPFDLMVSAHVPDSDHLVSELIDPLTENQYVVGTQTLMVVEHWRRASLQGDFFRI